MCGDHVFDAEYVILCICLLICLLVLVNWLTVRLDCWASAGHTSEGCAALEQQLRQCVDTPVCPLQCNAMHYLYVGVMCIGLRLGCCA